MISSKGNVATVKKSNGKVVSQAVIQDKADAAKPGRQPVESTQAPQKQSKGQATIPAQPQAGSQVINQHKIKERADEGD